MRVVRGWSPSFAGFDSAARRVMNNAGNMFVITCAALKNDIEYARRHDVHVFLTQVDDHKNDAREYFVDEVRRLCVRIDLHKLFSTPSRLLSTPRSSPSKR
jgi:hypothetical protein